MLQHWTLRARVDGRALELSLGDGRRMAWHARHTAAPLRRPTESSTVSELFGAELAGLLSGSGRRSLSVLYDIDSPLDDVDWEHLQLGGMSLAEHFRLSRQLVSAAEVTHVSDPAGAEALAVRVVHGERGWAHSLGERIPVDALGRPGACELVAQAHLLVLDGVPLIDFIERGHWPRGPHLLVCAGAVATRHLASALDAGAAVLCLPTANEFTSGSVRWLVHQLRLGQSVGEAVSLLHRRARPHRFGGRLYGDSEMRFVRLPRTASRRQVTSLCFDIVGSTTMIAELGDEAYAETLAAVHARCTDIVRRHGGQAETPQGDGVMCYFGHPVAIEDAAARAVHAGLDIARTVAEVGVTVRVGIATGRVPIIAGQPVGLSLHLAARLQKTAAPGTVLIAESTRRLVLHAFELEPLRERPVLKGFEAPQVLYLVVAPCLDAQERRLERSLALNPLVGRQAEIARLHACRRATEAGGSRLTVIRAEAGMGKSRLVREFRHQLVEAHVRVLECRCRADASASPFLALAEALRRRLAIGPHDDQSEALRKLTAAVPDHAREGEPLALLAAVLGIAPQPDVDSGRLRQRLLGLLLDWFHAFAGDRPSCLVVDDWHWVDPSMRELVEQLVERPPGPGLLVVITMRHEPAAASLPSTPDDDIELPGLEPDAARELVRHVCAGAPVPPRLITLLARRGDGVPLFLEEAARMALELEVDGVIDDPGVLESVPSSLQDLLTARLDSLGTAKPVAQVAAVLGRHFSRQLLVELLDAGGYAADAGAIDEHLTVLVDSRLVRAEGEGHFAFHHALIRDAAYGSLLERERRALHSRVVAMLQERWADLVAAQPELLARHLTEAGLHPQSVAQWELAARHAAARSAEREAISHLRRALAALVHTEPCVNRDRTALRLQLLLAARLLATEGYGADAVLKAYLEAEFLCNRIGDDMGRFKVEMGLEAYRFMRADFAPALEHGRRATAIAAQSGDRKQRIQAHWGQACTLFHQGDLRATMREMETALALYSPELHDQFGIQDPGVMCMAYSSWGLWELGRPDSALQRIQQAVAMTSTSDHRFSHAVALAYCVSIELLRGEAEAALARADACLRLCEEFGFPVWLAITRCMRGYLLCERGQFDNGLGEMSAGHAQWLATGAMVSQPLYLSLQVEGLLLAGQLDTALARIADGLAIVRRYGERQLECELTRLRGELALRRGESTEGEAWLKRAYALALRRHRLGFALRSATSLARLWAERGRRDLARRILVPLIGRWSEGRATRDLRAASTVLEALQ